MSVNPTLPYTAVAHLDWPAATGRRLTVEAVSAAVARRLAGDADVDGLAGVFEPAAVHEGPPATPLDDRLSDRAKTNGVGLRIVPPAAPRRPRGVGR